MNEGPTSRVCCAWEGVLFIMCVRWLPEKTWNDVGQTLVADRYERGARFQSVLWFGRCFVYMCDVTTGKDLKWCGTNTGSGQIRTRDPLPECVVLWKVFCLHVSCHWCVMWLPEKTRNDVGQALTADRYERGTRFQSVLCLGRCIIYMCDVTIGK